MIRMAIGSGLDRIPLRELEGRARTVSCTRKMSPDPWPLNASVEFSVKQPDGAVSKAVAEPVVQGERSGTVYYPYDFPNAGKKNGLYSWEARIAGKVAASGNSSYRPSKDGWLLHSPR